MVSHQEEWDTEEVLTFVYDVKPWKDMAEGERGEWCRRVRHILDNVVTDGKRWTHAALAPLFGVSRQALSQRLSWSEAYLTGDLAKAVKLKSRSPGEQTGDARRAFRNPDIESVVKADLITDALVDPEVAAAVARRIATEPALVRLVNQGNSLNSKRRSQSDPTELTEEHTVDLDSAWHAWLGRMNAILTVGVRLAEESHGSILNAHSELALYVYQQITERKLDAEIRDLFNSYEVTA